MEEEAQNETLQEITERTKGKCQEGIVDKKKMLLIGLGIQKREKDRKKKENEP